jgi:hypothetical protein
VSKPPELQFEYEIAAVDGRRGRQLAVTQAASLLEVLEWFGRTPKTFDCPTKNAEQSALEAG